MPLTSSITSEKPSQVRKTSLAVRKNVRSKAQSDNDNKSQIVKQGKRQQQLIEIIEFLKTCYLEDPDSEALTLDEIAKECNNLSLDSDTKDWLISEVFPKNSRITIQFTDNLTKFNYKPPIQLRGNNSQARALLNFLKVRYETCKEAITIDDVHDSTLKADKIIKILKDKGYIVVHRGKNKKDVLFYNHCTCDPQIHSDFINVWQSTSVEFLTDEQLRQVLNDHGHKFVEKDRSRQMPLLTNPSRRRRRTTIIKQNEHIANQLEVYDNLSGKT
jgi:hypothetical protein